MLITTASNFVRQLFYRRNSASFYVSNKKEQDMKNTFKIELNNTLNTLVAQREVWEDGVYKQANAELYAILEKCGEIYATLKEDKKNARVFNAIFEGLGVSFNKGTSLALKIVRVVFGAQSNREFAYASVIKIWHDERAEGQTLTNYVVEHGGVENVRRDGGKKINAKLSADDYREIAANAFADSNALTTFSVEEYMQSDGDNDTDYMVALVRCDGTGIGNLLYGSNKRALVNAALAVMGKEVDDLQKQQESTDALADKKQKTADNMKQFFANKQQQKAA
jgi:hypothetical protein